MKSLKLLLIFTILLTGFGATSASVWRITDRLTADVPGDGTSWDNPAAFETFKVPVAASTYKILGSISTALSIPEGGKNLLLFPF